MTDAGGDACGGGKPLRPYKRSLSLCISFATSALGLKIMAVSAVVILVLLAVFADAQTASPVSTATDTYIPHVSYPYSDTYGTGPISAYRETPAATYADPPSTSLVSISIVDFLNFTRCTYLILPT